jgi:Txe/YoeB family toxin of Txe-Axe toxin-antitoxin module
LFSHKAKIDNVKQLNPNYMSVSKIQNETTGIQYPCSKGNKSIEIIRLFFRYTGCWSREITEKRRLLYKIDTEKATVTVYAAYGHYDDK